MTAMTSEDLRSKLAAANQALAEADAELEAARATAALADDKPSRENLRKAQVRRADAQEVALNLAAAVPAAERAEAEQRHRLQVEAVHRAAREGIALDATAIRLRADARRDVLAARGVLLELDSRIRAHDTAVAKVRQAGGIPRVLGAPSAGRGWAQLVAELDRLAEAFN